MEKERNDRREIELMDFIDALEKQISSQRSDLAVAGTDLQAAAVHRTSLERRIEDLTRRASAPDSAALAHAASSSSLQARFDEMESIAVELTHRAESAESTLKMLMAAGGTTDAIINPRTSIVESTLINRNSFDGSVKVIAEPIIHSDNGRISTQNSVEIMQPNYEMGRFTVSEQGNDHNSRRNSILSQGDDSIYNRMRNQTQQQFQSVTDYTIPSAIPPEEDMQIRMPRPFLPTATPKKTSRKTKSKSGLDTSRSSIPGQGESLMSSRKKNSKLAESMESGDSRISADARKAYLLQNLSLGSDHGLVLVSRKDAKVATHRKIVPGKRVSTSATPTGSKGILRTSSVPAEISRQNAQYLRLSESVITATPRSVQSKSEKKPSRTKYVMSEKSVGERYDLKGRNGVGNVKFASSGPVRYVANTRSPAVSATKRPSSAVPVSKSTPSRGPTVIISDRDAGRYRPLVRL